MVVQNITDLDNTPVEIDGTKSWEELCALGNPNGSYPVTSSSLWPIVNKTKRTSIIKFFYFPELRPIMSCLTVEEVANVMKIANFQPSTIEELLSVGAAYPTLQWNYKIIGLGSIGNHYGHVAPVMRSYGNQRALVEELLPNNYLIGSDSRQFYYLGVKNH